MMMNNGKLVEDEKIHLDRGFLYGLGVFETLLVKEGKPIFLKAHIDRLNKGLKTLNIEQSLSEEEVRGQIETLQAETCAVRISVSDQNQVLTTRPVTYKSEDYESGFSLKISEITRNPKSHVTYIKSLNYIDNGLERERAIEEGFNEVLFLNGDGFVAEGSTTNVFWMKDGKLYTPAIECGLLEGVMRRWVMSQHPVVEGHFSLDSLLTCEGAFLTNSLMGIMKVNQIGDMAIGQHPITQKIQSLYAKFLEEYCHE